MKFVGFESADPTVEKEIRRCRCSPLSRIYGRFQLHVGIQTDNETAPFHDLGKILVKNHPSPLANGESNQGRSYEIWVMFGCRKYCEKEKTNIKKIIFMFDFFIKNKNKKSNINKIN